MLKDQVVSVTDLRTKTKHCLQGLDDNPKFIFANNKMVAVIINVEEYEALTRPDLHELSMDEVSEDMLNEAKEVRNIPKEELVDL